MDIYASGGVYIFVVRNCRMNHIEFNIINQKEQMKVLEDLTSNLNLSLGFRNRFLPLPLTAIHISNCNGKCLVQIDDQNMYIIVVGKLSEKQLNYVNKVLKDENEITVAHLKEEWKKNINNEHWLELRDINQSIRVVINSNGQIKIRNLYNKTELTFTVPLNKTAHNNG